MKNSDRLRLLNAILASQSEGVAGAVIAEDRLRQALTDGPPFTREEKRILWLSPDTRALLVMVRREVQAQIADRVKAAGYGQPVRLLAAAGGNDYEKISGSGWTLQIFRDDIPGAEWSLSLELDDDYAKLLPLLATVTLRDSGGQTWISGSFDASRRIEGIWPLASETPFDRLKRYALMISP
jgi:hypothetical protein